MSTHINEKLKGKLAIIIGASGGVGRELAKLLIEQNIKVVGTFCSNANSLLELKEKGLQTLKFNFSDGPAPLLNKLTELKTTPYIVVNCATTPLSLKRFEDLSADEIKHELDASLTGPVLLTHALLKSLASQKEGIFIHILSKSTHTHPARMSVYTLAKAGLESLIKSASKEITSGAIKLIGISPSFIETELLKMFPKKMLEMEQEKRPSKTLLQPAEVANVILNVIANPENYKNGEIISID